MNIQPKTVPEVSISMTETRTAEIKPALYVLILVVALLAGFIYKLRAEGVFACPASGYGSDQYLAYCQTNGYGDYDHGAFWFGLEPDALRAAADADVLFLGNSRMQFAFSTEATRRWFSSSATAFYLFGFSFGENYQFEGPLLASLKPRAKVYVINVDRFFDDDWVTSPTEAIRHRPSEAQTSFEEKKRWQAIHKGICTSVPGICGHEVAFFRSRSNGVWQLKGTENFKAAAVSDATPDAEDVARWKQYGALGNEFISRLPVDRRCVVLTIAPWEATKASEARAIAEALQLELVAPKLDNLRTMDGDHLDLASAEKWSAAFFEAAGPRIRQCLLDSRTTAR